MSLTSATSLMTFHTTNIIACCDLDTGGEYNGVLGNGPGIVACHTLHALGFGGTNVCLLFGHADHAPGAGR